jgi:DNA (cytosine-5)-methyltransferase 1
MWFVKVRRAQNDQDFETWKQGGVATTLNVMDNTGESRATVLIIDGTRVNDVRVYEDGIVPTVISRYGTGGGNVPMIFEPKSAFEENWAESDIKNALRAGASKSAHAVVENQTVRRLTPIECERLQGFPDNWTEDQADTHRYKQMGNAVAVPVVSWIIDRLVRANDELV